MKTSLLLPLAIGAAVALLPQTGSGALLLYYSFDDVPLGSLSGGESISNLAGGPNGVFRAGTAGGSASILSGPTVSGGPLGRVLSLAPASDAADQLAAPHIDTTLSALALQVTPGTAYTAMAWAFFESTVGDNMIFGQQRGTPDGVLHHGSRNGNYHSGHWGDDRGPDQEVFVPTGTGTWAHVAFTNDTAGTQKMFVNGSEIDSGALGTAGTMNTAQNLLIGTSGNNGSFAGRLDEIKIYNETLTAEQIQQAAVVPEPTTAVLFGMAAAGLGLMRRRKAAL